MQDSVAEGSDLMVDNLIRVSAVVIRDGHGALLTVRKVGSTRFMLPGGKPEPGESPIDTAIRECAEEIGLALQPSSLREVGTCTTDAANEPGFALQAVVFELAEPMDTAARDTIRAAAEIAELTWLDITDPTIADASDADPDPDAASDAATGLSLAPLLTEYVLPLLRR